jgi:hypothetical protein
MTDQQRANLASARRLAAARIGWTGSTESIPYAQREAYATALAQIILTYPQRFDALTVSIAQRELVDRPNEPLSPDSTSDRAGVFFGELGNQAVALGESVAAVGEGIKTTLSLASILIPAAALFALYIAARGYARRHG